MKTFFNDLINHSDFATADTSKHLNTIIEEYLLSPCIPQEEDLPAFSAPVERLFSIAGKFFRPDRCHLTDKQFEEHMFIRYVFNKLSS